MQENAINLGGHKLKIAITTAVTVLVLALIITFALGGFAQKENPQTDPNPPLTMNPAGKPVEQTPEKDPNVTPNNTEIKIDQPTESRSAIPEAGPTDLLIPALILGLLTYLSTKKLTKATEPLLEEQD